MRGEQSGLKGSPYRPWGSGRARLVDLGKLARSVRSPGSPASRVMVASVGLFLESSRGEGELRQVCPFVVLRNCAVGIQIRTNMS